MLLSMAVSLLFAKKLGQRAYVVSLAAALVIISVLSAGIPFSESRSYPDDLIVYPSAPESQRGVVIRFPLPLTFPFYAFINHTVQQIDLSMTQQYSWVDEYYQLTFLSAQLPQSLMHTVVYRELSSPIGGYVNFTLDWGDYLLYLVFFLQFNLVGAIVGYWISKSAFLERHVRSGVALMSQLIDAVNVKHLMASYILLSTIDIAQTVVVFPEYEVGLFAQAFIIFLSQWAWLYFPFRIALTAAIVVAVYRFVTPPISKKLFALLSLLTLVSAILNTYSLTRISNL